MNAPHCGLSHFVKVENGARQADDDADEDDQRHAVADAAFGDLFAQPHDERRAGRERENRHQDEAEARDDRRDCRQCAACSAAAMVEGLHDAQDDGQIARLLSDLAAAEFAFFCKLLEVGNTTVINCRMIDDVMYGMMPSAKIVSRRKFPPLNRSKIRGTSRHLLEEWIAGRRS